MVFVQFFHSFRYDPDILLGYEIQMHSWGYLLQRAAALSVDLCQMISRVPGMKCHECFVFVVQLQSKLLSKVLESTVLG